MRSTKVASIVVQVVLFLGVTWEVKADYNCFCNYEVELQVHTSSDVTSSAYGYMYEFDCKQMLDDVYTTEPWIAIAYEHHVGYVQKSSSYAPQVCQGEPSTDDLVTTTTLVTIATSTASPGTPITSPKPQSTTTPTTTPQPTTTTTMSTTTPTTPTPTTQTTTTQRTTTPIVTTNAPTTSTSTTTSTTSTPAASTTPPHKPTTSSTTSTVPTTTGLLVGQTNLCDPSIHQRITSGYSNNMAQYGHKCYEFVSLAKFWLAAENWCRYYNGHLVQIGSHGEQVYLNNFMMHHRLQHEFWIGLHDRNREEHFEWTSGGPVTFTNWSPHRKDPLFHGTEDCVFTDPRPGRLNGQWDDADCIDDHMMQAGVQRKFICQYELAGATTAPTSTTTVVPVIITQPSQTLQPVTVNNINLCPNRVLQNSPQYNLGQYGHYCYEIIAGVKHTWDQSEAICRSNGGHLVTIADQAEQDYVQNFVQGHSPQHAVWIGLNDVNVEGRFEWSSGHQVSYTHWVPGHLNNFVNHNEEDCVVLVPYQNGIWDDIPCGHQGFFNTDVESHYAVCQYIITATVATSPTAAKTSHICIGTLPHHGPKNYDSENSSKNHHNSNSATTNTKADNI